MAMSTSQSPRPDDSYSRDALQGTLITQGLLQDAQVAGAQRVKRELWP